ncbi:unnamed protein product [marine sediment metagenome]|uniref:Uncharacterized protein n=1 Tax=marine sediment metagenome TaxID=412755 RepID=X1E892_9ZZZZ
MNYKFGNEQYKHSIVVIEGYMPMLFRIKKGKRGEIDNSFRKGFPKGLVTEVIQYGGMFRNEHGQETSPWYVRGKDGNPYNERFFLFTRSNKGREI